MSNPVQLQETEAKSALITEGNKTFCENYFLFFSLVNKYWKKGRKRLSHNNNSPMVTLGYVRGRKPAGLEPHEPFLHISSGSMWL